MILYFLYSFRIAVISALSADFSSSEIGVAPAFRIGTVVPSTYTVSFETLNSLLEDSLDIKIGKRYRIEIEGSDEDNYTTVDSKFYYGE